MVGSIVLGIANVAGTLGNGAAVARTGKRALLVGSHVVMGASMALLALGAATHATSALLSPLALALAFILGFALGAGPLPWILMAELLPEDIKGGGLGISAGVNWAANILVSSTFPSLQRSVGLPGADWPPGDQ